VPIRVLGSHVLLIEGDGEGLEIIEVVGSLSNQIALDLVFEALIERQSDDLFVLEFHLEDKLLECFDILADGAGLLQACVEAIAGLLLGIEVCPLVNEILLEQFPANKVGGSLVFILGEF